MSCFRVIYFLQFVYSQARRQGVHGVRMHPPQESKGMPDGIVKDLKLYKISW